jgi:hypothetical protein
MILMLIPCKRSLRSRERALIREGCWRGIVGSLLEGNQGFPLYIQALISTDILHHHVIHFVQFVH